MNLASASAVVLSVLLLCGCRNPAPEAADRSAAVPKVILIGIDGVRPDVLEQVDAPNLDALIATGAYTDSARTGLPTVSGPSWASMLTGVWKEKHGILSNDFPFPGSGLGESPDFLTRIERFDPELRTYAAGDWTPLFEQQRADDGRVGDPVVSDEIDEKVVHDGYELGWAQADSLVVDAALRELADNDPAAMFVYLGNPDEVSHETGSIGEPYQSAIMEADDHVGRIVAAIRSRATYADEDWLILVSTDHGRRPDGGHGGESREERTIFILAHGARIAPDAIRGDAEIVDVPATALRYLGVGLEAGWGLDGEAVTAR